MRLVLARPSDQGPCFFQGYWPMPTAIERRERRLRKQHKWDLRWAEANEEAMWVAFQAAKALRRARGKASMVQCLLEVRFGKR